MDNVICLSVKRILCWMQKPHRFISSPLGAAASHLVARPKAEGKWKVHVFIGGDLFWDNKLSRQKSPKGFFGKCASKKVEKKRKKKLTILFKQDWK